MSDPKTLLFKQRWKELLDDDAPLSVKSQPNTRQSYVSLLKSFYGNREDLRNALIFDPPDQVRSSSKPKAWLHPLIEYSNQLDDFDIQTFDPCANDGCHPVQLAEKMTRGALQAGFTAHYLLHLISLDQPDAPPDGRFQSFLHRLTQALHKRIAPRDIEVYAPITGGSRKRGKRYSWAKLPPEVTGKFDAQETSADRNCDYRSQRFLCFTGQVSAFGRHLGDSTRSSPGW